MKVEHLTFKPEDLDFPSGRRVREAEMIETFCGGKLLTRQKFFRFYL